MRFIVTLTFLLSTLSSITSLISCTSSTSVATSDVHLVYSGTELETSSVFTKQTFVKLESTPQCATISNINRILCSDSLLFILDKINNKVISFDYEGNFINSTLEMIGHAKNEYVHLCDAAIDEDFRRIYLYCDIPYQMLILDYDLEVVDCIPMNDFLLEITLDSEYIYGLYPDIADGSKYDIRCFKKDNLTGDPTILIVQNKAISNVKGMGNMLNRFGSVIYASLPFDNKIYKISEGIVMYKWNINLGDRWFEYGKSKKMRGRDFLNFNIDKHWTIQNIVSSSTDIIFNTNQTNVFKLSIERNECVDYARLINNTIPFSNSWLISTTGIYDVAFAIPATNIVDYYNYYSDRKEELPKNGLNYIIQSTSPEDNPIIVLAKIK